MKYIFITVTFFCTILMSSKLTAQDPDLMGRLAGKDRVEEIMDIVEAYYADHEEEHDDEEEDEEEDGAYAKWARWGLYMSARTDDEGRLVNVDRRIRSAYEAYATHQRSSAGNWIPRGPNSISGINGSAVGIGRVDRIAFHPTDANTLYIGSPAGGLFKSTNGGSSWTPLTDNIPSTAISGIVVSHANPNTIYILTGDGDTGNSGFIVSAGYWKPSAGVFVSYDAGSNWNATGALPIVGEYAGYQLVQDPNNANVLLAATNQGIYRTSNGGNSWTQVLTGLTFEIKFKPGSSGFVYATQNGSFFRSPDGGVTWAHITNFDFPLMAGRVAMAVTNGFSSRVCLMSGWANDGATFGGVYISYDSGASFSRQSNTPNIVESSCDGDGGNNQSWSDLAIAVSHTESSKVLAAGITTWRSTNTGVTWTNASAGRCDGSTSTGYVHADVHDIEYSPLNGAVYLCSDGGLIKSSNHGVDWVNLSDGIAASMIYHLAGTITDLENMIIGLQDNGSKRRNANTSVWDQVLSADGFDCIYNVGSNTEGYLSANSKLSRFSDNGLDLVDITPLTSDNKFPRVTSAIDDGDLVLAGYVHIYKSTNGGDTWVEKNVPGSWDLERCPSNANRFYAAGGASAFATTGSMWKSNDKGDTWTIISDSPGFPSVNIRLTDIGVRSTVSGNVWIVFGGFSNGNKVFFSSDAGESWSNMSSSLPNVPVNAIQVDAGNNAYIGTDIGVFYRGAGMNDWVPFWHRLPIIQVSDLELYEADNIIRASTFGRGVWESDTYSTCAQTINITSMLSGNRYYETSNYISCGSIITGGQNTRVIFKAANFLELKIGFEAKAGNTVHAYLAPCGVAQNED
ncbi:MAG TPA: hypothetical protein VFG10_13675 [Saprospiraceae bacterium]|nr:hypothetical protein [Saprospiraceae bacterium]